MNRLEGALMNLLGDPAIVYMRAWLGARLQQLHSEDRSRGASAIEWAIITGILASIAIAIGLVIFNKVKDAGNSIQVGDGSGNGAR
jgi:Flp pilus assembly pilin Flp